MPMFIPGNRYGKPPTPDYVVEELFSVGAVYWCHTSWGSAPGMPTVSNPDKCKSCKNHILRLGGGQCWKLDYEERD